jgi:hypothetical protein
MSTKWVIVGFVLRYHLGVCLGVNEKIMKTISGLLEREVISARLLLNTSARLLSQFVVTSECRAGI